MEIWKFMGNLQILNSSNELKTLKILLKSETLLFLFICFLLCPQLAMVVMDVAKEYN